MQWKTEVDDTGLVRTYCNVFETQYERGDVVYSQKREERIFREEELVQQALNELKENKEKYKKALEVFSKMKFDGKRLIIADDIKRGAETEVLNEAVLPDKKYISISDDCSSYSKSWENESQLPYHVISNIERMKDPLFADYGDMIKNDKFSIKLPDGEIYEEEIDILDIPGIGRLTTQKAIDTYYSPEFSIFQEDAEEELFYTTDMKRLNKLAKSGKFKIPSSELNGQFDKWEARHVIENIKSVANGLLNPRLLDTIEAKLNAC